MSHIDTSHYVGDHLLFQANRNGNEPRLLTFSKARSNSRDSQGAHMHPYLEIFYFESGEGSFEYNKQIYPIGAHDLLIVGAQQFHQQYENSNESPLIYYNLTVDLLAVSSASGHFMAGKPFLYHHFDDQDNRIFQAICAIRDELEKKEYRYASKIHAQFQMMMIDLERLLMPYASPHTQMPQRTTNQTRLAEVKGYMEAHYTESLSIQQLCRMAMFQKSYFIRQFKETYGFSPTRYLNLIRIENAKLLLSNSEMNITEIAARVGFNHPSYFSEIFFKYEGLSPTQYRLAEAQKKAWIAPYLTL